MIQKANINVTTLTRDVVLNLTDKEPSTYGHIIVEQDNIGGHFLLLGEGLEGDVPLYELAGKRTLIQWIALEDVIHVYSELSPNYDSSLPPNGGGAVTVDLSNYYTKSQSNDRYAPIIHNHSITSLDGADLYLHTHTNKEYLDTINQNLNTSASVAFDAVNANVGNINVVNATYINATEKVTTKDLEATNIKANNALVDTIRVDEISSKEFVSGFGGEGFRLSKNSNGDYSLEVDNISVRKEMDIYQLTVNEVKATNGSIWVSDGIEAFQVATDGTHYTCTIDSADASIAVPFQVNDIVRCQKFNGKDVKYYTALVTATTSDFFTLEILDGGGIPASGDKIVRIGNTTDNTRKGALYLTSSDSGSPYLDVIDGVDTASFTGKTKVRLGKLDGIIDPNFGALSGYGIYAQNGYFKGKIQVVAGSGSNVYNKSETNDYVNNTAGGISQGYYFLSTQYTDTKTAEAITTANQFTQNAIADVQGDITAVSDALEVVKTENNTQFQVLENQINSKVEQSDYNALNQTVANQQTQITQNATAITSKVEKTEFTELENTVDGINATVANHTTQISQKADRIELTALSSTVDSLGNTVASNTAQIEINSNAITSKVWTADIETSINKIQIGGRNLLLNSANIKKGINDTEPTYNQFWRVDITHIDQDIKVGDDVTISFDIQMEVGTRIEVYDQNNSNGKYFGLKAFNNIGTQKQRLVWTTEVIDAGAYSGVHILDFYNGNNGDRFTIENIKIEIGNKGTDWSPSPFDLNTKVNDLTIRMTSAESEIIQTSTAISQKVWSTDIETSINKIQIGGRNLLRYSNTLEVFDAYGATGDANNKSAPEQLSKQIIRFENITRLDGYGSLVFYIPVGNRPYILDRDAIYGQEAVFSFRARANANFIMDFGGGTRIGEADIDTNWRTYAYKMIIGNTGNWHFAVIGDNLQWMEFTGFKVELGNKYSSWTLNPDDESLGGTNTYSNRLTPVQILGDASNLVKNHANSPNGFMVTGGSSYASGVRIENVIDSNDWWTISGYVKNDQSTLAPFKIDMCDNSKSHTFTTNNNNTWTYFEFSYFVNNYNGSNGFIDFSELGWNYFYFKDIKVEKGNKATAWSPSPKDIDQQFSDVNTRITSAETAITQTNTNITLSASKTEAYLKQSLNIDYANGKNKWLFNKYDYPNATGTTAPKLEMITNLTSDYIKLVPDATDLLRDIADGYIGHYRCMVFASSGQGINFGCSHDDGMTVYVNGVIKYESATYQGSAVVDLPLELGWNTIDMLYMEGAGGDGIYNISNLVMHQVTSMYAVTSSAITQSTVTSLDKNTYDGNFERGLELWSQAGNFYAPHIIPSTCRIVPNIGINGSNVWRVEGGEGWLYSLKPIPVVRGHRYRLTVRYCVRQHATTGASPTYCGFSQYYPDGSTPPNLGLEYFVFTGENLPADNLNTWYTRSREYQMNLTGYNSDIAYIKVAMGFNYGNHNAIIDCDSLILEDITQEWESRTYTNSQITIVNDAITATSTRVDNLSGRMNTAEFKLQPDQINLTVSEQVRVSTDKTSQLVDLRALDPNTSYPVCIALPGDGKRIRITATRSLGGGSGVPPYATHGAGFSLSMIWTTNGSGWGTQPRIENIEKSMVVFVNDSRGWGSVQQNTMASHEIFYLRGGSLYTVTIEGSSNPNNIILYSSGYYWESSPTHTYSAPIISHIHAHLPEVSYQTKADIQAGITITSNAINIYGQSLTLTGAVTFESLDTSTQGNINTANSNASNALNTANNAQGTINNWTYVGTTEINGGAIRTGTITADKLDTQLLVARQMKTSETASRLSINEANDNTIKVRHPNGQVGIEMGLQAGEPRLVFYNSAGTKIWEGGMAGIVYVTNIPESWRYDNLFKILDWFGYPPDSNQLDYIQQELQLFIQGNAQGAYVQGNTDGHLYNAGQNANTSSNEQYNGYHPYQNKLSGWIDDGWYCAGDTYFIMTGTGEYTVEVFYIQNGKVMYTDNVIVWWT